MRKIENYNIYIINFLQVFSVFILNIDSKIWSMKINRWIQKHFTFRKLKRVWQAFLFFFWHFLFSWYCHLFIFHHYKWQSFDQVAVSMKKCALYHFHVENALYICLYRNKSNLIYPQVANLLCKYLWCELAAGWDD